MVDFTGGAPPGAPSKTPFKPAYMRTDLGNAERFVARSGSDVRFVAPWKKWYLWSGRHWSEDLTLDVHQLAKSAVRAIWSEIPNMSEEDRPAWAAHALQSESNSKILALLARGQSEPGIPITPDQLDADPWLLAVHNGVIDLKTGKLRRHRRELLMTKVSPASFDPDARCDLWEAFLARVLGDDQELIQFVQRAVGYSLTGTISERKLFFLYGSGANGKSTFLEILRALLAEYARQADFTTFLERRNSDAPRNDIARLFGARVVTSSEVGEGKRLNESVIKQMTGNEVLTARFLHAEHFEFLPQFKLWLAANHRPVIRGTDPAIWDRVRLIPFTVQIPEAERDLGLKDKLLAELPGILAWAVAGCVLWQRDGLGMAERVADATSAYRRESDTLGAFLEECTEVDRVNPECAVRSTDLYAAYRRWAEDGGEFVMSQTRFGRDLEERGFIVDKRGRGNERVKWRVGLRLTVPLFPEPRRSAKADGPTGGEF